LRSPDKIQRSILPTPDQQYVELRTLSPVPNSPGKGLFSRLPVMVSTRRKLQLIGSFVFLVLMAMAVGCNGFFVDPILVSIAVTPPTPTLVVGGSSFQMTAFGTYDDGSKKDINSKVIWTMTPPGYATITAAGLLTGTSPSPSTVTLQASDVDIVGTTTFQVFSNITAVNVTPSTQTVSVSAGTPVCLQAIATTSTGQQDISSSATWTFTDPSGQTESGLTKTTALTCSQGQPFSIGTSLLPTPIPVILGATASAPSSSGGTVTSNKVTVGLTQ
jgi:trimeric autotransporter adhesin